MEFGVCFSYIFIIYLRRTVHVLVLIHGCHHQVKKCILDGCSSCQGTRAGLHVQIDGRMDRDPRVTIQASQSDKCCSLNNSRLDLRWWLATTTPTPPTDVVLEQEATILMEEQSKQWEEITNNQKESPFRPLGCRLTCHHPGAVDEWSSLTSVIVHLPPTSGPWIPGNQAFSVMILDIYSFMSFAIRRILETVCLCGPWHLWRINLNWLGCNILYCDKKNKNNNTCNYQFWFLSVHIQPLFLSVHDRQLNSPCPSSSLELARLSLTVRAGNTCVALKVSFYPQFSSKLLRLITENNGCYTNCRVKIYVWLFLLKYAFHHSHGWARRRWHQNFVSGKDGRERHRAGELRIFVTGSEGC